MRFDPKLRVSPEAAYDIEMSGFGAGLVPVLISSAYHAPLTCEFVSGEAFVRAATGDEVTNALTTGLAEDDDGLDWPGDTPLRLAQRLNWRERSDSPLQEDEYVRLWSGEVIFDSGLGTSGPYYVHQMAAAAWAFSTALAEAAGGVFECQLVPYACVRRLAPGVLRCGEAEARRLSRFDVAPLRPWGRPTSISFHFPLPVSSSDGPDRTAATENRKQPSE